MSIDKVVLAFAGSMILFALVLSNWFPTVSVILLAFIGLNLLQSAFTGFCPLAIVLKKLGFQAGCAFE